MTYTLKRHGLSTLYHSPILLTSSDRRTNKEILPRIVNKVTGWNSFRIQHEKSVNLSVPLENDQKNFMKRRNSLLGTFNKLSAKNIPEVTQKGKGKYYLKEIMHLIREN